MRITGRCYCGNVRYSAEGEPSMRAQCHCRECQYISGGGAVLIMGMPAEGFRFTRGAAKSFTRDDIPNPVTRDFCPDCGTHLATRPPGIPFVFTPERFSRSPRNPVRLAPESALPLQPP